MRSDLLRSHDCATADPATRQMMGCDSPVEEGLEWECLGLRFDRCPAFYETDPDFVKDAMQIYNWREKGILPFPGALVDQPAIVLEVCSFLDVLVTERQNQELARMKKNKVPHG